MRINSFLGKVHDLLGGHADPVDSGSTGPSNAARVSMKGMECPGLARASLVGKPHPEETFEVSMMLDRSRPLRLEDLKGQNLTRREFSNRYGADQRDIAAVQRFAKDNGLEITGVDPESRMVRLKGSVSAYEKAFGVEIGNYRDPECGPFRGYKGSVQLPRELASKVVGVFGLNNRPTYQTHFRFKSNKIGPFATSQVSTTYTPTQVAGLYNAPQGTTGKGQTIGIVEFGGGYKTADLQNYFQKIGAKMPSVSSVGVDGATNSPTGDPNGPDGEVDLDIEVAGAVAPDANIKVYFAPNDDKGSVDVISQMIKDGVNVISISWGGDETSWTPQTMQAMNQLFQEAAAKGVTVLAASGDDGSSDGVKDGKPHADFPASSPFVTGCGGTSLYSKNGKITRETAWNNGSIFGGGATGGAFSSVFARPDWQKIDPSYPNMRGVSDVSSVADPNTGYDTISDGQEGVTGGTSASAPFWAGLIARINEGVGHPVGYINPVIYTPQFAGAFHDITQGNNGAYKATKGWDPPTGLGSPDGEKLLEAFQQLNKQGGNAFSGSKMGRFLHRFRREAA